jgi:acyl dehydratase
MLVKTDIQHLKEYNMHSRFFEGFTVGDKFESRSASLSESQIIDFAMMYDPQHMHIDKAAAEQGPFGGLIASGFQTLALSFRLFYDIGLITQTNIIGPGMDKVVWHAPVFAGDTIRVFIEILEARPSKSKPDRGIILWGFTTKNQNGEVVMSAQAPSFIRRQPSDN